MAIIRLEIQEFLKRSANNLLLDVRSPAEYSQAHITNSHSMPLFTDAERKTVGTAYKQQSREDAIKYGLDFFGPKMRSMVEMVEKLQKMNHGNKNNEIFIHCWRGGMRSNAVAWLLDLFGFQTYVLEGGYKSYRNWVLLQFKEHYPLRIIGGYTGSGKTYLLNMLKKNEEVVVDLEGIAHHKGSAFGGIGQAQQPSQEMFENHLAEKLFKSHNKLYLLNKKAIWIEDESQRIGVLNIPLSFWKTMRNSPIYFINISFDNRLKFIQTEYGNLPKEKLLNAIIRIQKRLGPQETKSALHFLLNDKIAETFRILLCYYDKHYEKALYNRENIIALLNKIECSGVDETVNYKKILLCDTVTI